MIYVIKAYGPEGETSIKIGYTKDKNFNKRMKSYKTHNPFYELLFTIPDCTQEDEDNLHFYFRKYNKETEWFEECEEIIEFFNTHKTKESIDKLGLSRDLFRCKSGGIKAESMLFKAELARWIKNNESTLSDIVKKVLKYVIKRDDFYYVMKFICENIYFNENEKVSEDDKELILSELPLDYSKYLTTLGPDRCKANGYHITRIMKEFDTKYKTNFANLKSKILSEFKVGEKYLKSDIKEKLGIIYSSLSYTKTPKANDLENYFDVKGCTVLKDGKKSAAFEILKEKS